MIKVDVSGADRATKELIERLSPRRFSSVVAGALTRVAVAGRAALQDEMRKVFDKPTPYTLASVRYREARPEKLQSEVYLSAQRGARDPSPAVVLGPHVTSGGRGFKGLELALRSSGALPAGWFVVPARGARLDPYGNVSRGLITQVLAQLRRQSQYGPKDARRIVRTVRKAGGTFFAIPPGGKTQPGVYLSDVVGRNITPIFLFVNRSSYRKRLPFDEVIRRQVQRALPEAIARGFGESLGRLAGGTGARVVR